MCLTFGFGCVEEPIKESVPELITKIMLTFTPSSGPPIIVSATDPDGEGVQNISAEGAIVLQQNKSYTLAITLFNELADPTSPEHNLTNEVSDEGDEHIFFFAWTNNMFTTPVGDGNLDNRNDAMQYLDVDRSGLPIGLVTHWETARAGKGTFRIQLKHQPEIKSPVSSSADGETDLDLTFDLEVR
jgi:hypothetical protein